MHEDENVEILRLGPERVEFIAVIIVVMDVGGDVRAAKTEFRDGLFQHSRGARWLLYRHGGYRGETIGMFFEEFTDALIVKPTPAFRPLATERVPQNIGARLERRHGDLALIHHCEARRFVRQPLLQCILRSIAERKVNRSVFFLRDFNPKPFAVSPAFLDQLLWDEVMMNINRASPHNLLLSNF